MVHRGVTGTCLVQKKLVRGVMTFSEELENTLFL